MANFKIQTGLRLEESLYLKFKALADLEGRSINNLAEYVIRLYVNDYERSHGPLLPPQHQEP